MTKSTVDLAANDRERPAMIEVRGARQNNLTGIDVDVPKRRLVVFTGVSGSGKSSLVFGTIAAESQRLINETYTAFLQSLMPALPRPDVDELRHLSAAVVVDQERLTANSRSTVGTATDTWTLLRLLFARAGRPAVASASALSFNDPSGMCPECEGVGRVSSVDLDAIVDRSLSLNDGAIQFPNFGVGSLFWKVYVGSGFFDNDKPVAKYNKSELERLLRGKGGKVDTGGYDLTYEGLLDKIERLYLSKSVDSLQANVKRAVEAAATFADCPACDGTRLNEAALACKFNRRNIAQCASMQITELAHWLDGVKAPKGVDIDPLVNTLRSTVDNLIEIGLGYISLSRPTGTLSGGEAQRVKMVRHLDSALTDMTYVFDEPTAGLHAHDTERMIRLLRRLRDKGNTVLVVEHDADVIAAADHVLDLGPGAGNAGGQVMFEGTPTDLAASDTATGRHLNRRQEINPTPRTATGSLRIGPTSLHNLKKVTVDLPLGALTAVTGVAGSGKSSLILGSMPPSERVAVLDQQPIKGSRRSNLATYTGVFDTIRKVFAKTNGVKPGLFSANSDGACDVCSGLGVIYTDLAHLDTVASPCLACGGRRFKDEVLDYELRGASIADVLAMPISEAAEFFTEKNERTVREMLSTVTDVGIGYVLLGQPLTTLSGGERQRLRLAIELAGDADIYVLDEPSTGLHLADVDRLIALLQRIVDDGATVVVIEHNLDIVARADHVIDIGPGAGSDGGRVVFAGPPSEVVNCPESITGKHLGSNHRLAVV